MYISKFPDLGTRQRTQRMGEWAPEPVCTLSRRESFEASQSLKTYKLNVNGNITDGARPGPSSEDRRRNFASLSVLKNIERRRTLKILKVIELYRTILLHAVLYG
jgi:hypothetical protein